MLHTIKSLFTLQGWSRFASWGTGMRAATSMPSDPPPTKVANRQQSLPAFLKTAKPATTSPLLRTDRALANKDVLDYRLGNDSRKIIRDFTRSDPNLSAAVTSYIRTGITAGYTAIARNTDGTVNPEATQALAQIITRMNVLNDYTMGYDDGRSIRSISEAWAREVFTMGAMCGELVLDKLRMPSHIVPLASEQIRMFPSGDGRKLIPKQFIAGEYISLDIPTFFMVLLDEDLMEPYPVSPIEPAVQAVLFGAEFLNDIRRVVRRAIHPRTTVTIKEEVFKKNLPPAIQNDTEKINAYMAQVVSDIETKVNGMAPEDALVFFDTLGIDVIDHGNTNLSNEYTVIQGIADAKLAAGAKTLPTVLGHSNGTSNTASAEVLLFMKFVEGTVWAKLNEMFSKLFTLAVRLLGHDVVVDFRYNAIDLKPESELESFKSMKQSRLLQLCSLGFLDDAETSILLTGALPPNGMKPLSGTGFFGAQSVEPAGDGHNGASNGGSTMNHATRATTPTAPKGGAGKGKAEGNLVVVQ